MNQGTEAKAMTPEANTLPKEHYLNAGYGWKSWLLTTDHKRIAILYLVVPPGIGKAPVPRLTGREDSDRPEPQPEADGHQHSGRDGQWRRPQACEGENKTAKPPRQRHREPHFVPVPCVSEQVLLL